LKNKDLALILLVNFLWASNFLAAKIGMEEFPPLFFTALRFALVIVVMLPFVSLPHGYWRKLMVVGFMMGILHYSLMFWGLSIAPDISPVAIVNQTFVPFSALLAVIFLKERLGWRRWTAIIIAFVGVMIIGFDPVIFDSFLSPGLVAIASFFLSVNMVIVRTMPGIGALNLTFWTAAIAFLPILMLSFIFETGQIDGLQSSGWQEWLAVAFSAIGATVIGHGLGNYLIKFYPVSTIAPYYLLVPVFAIILGVVFWGDQITLELMVGGAMVMAGVTIITFRSNRRRVVEGIDGV
jgi:O-acetylserine/cysteine efflux transporter